jgi:hypothetical protein
MKYLIQLVIPLILFFFIISVNSFAQDKNKWLVDQIFRFETELDEMKTRIQKMDNDIDKNDASIKRSENIIALAQQKGNSQAEKVAQDALQNAKDAKQKNIDTRSKAYEYLIKLNAVLEYLKTNPDDAELKSEQFKFESKSDEYLKSQSELVQDRLINSQPYVTSLITSLKTKVPPPLPGKSFDELEPGDVLLVGNENKSLITVTDNFFSGTNKSQASHTLIYLKEINGKKMFLDDQPGVGPKIISEDLYASLYGKRPTDVAHLLTQPVKPEDGEKLYKIARELAEEQYKYKMDNSDKLFIGTKYGVKGTDMVCSEADRWVLLKADYKIPESEDAIKKLLGVEYSPADYYKSCYFMVTPLSGIPTDK